MSGATVLVADDDSAIRIVVGQALRRSGFDVKLSESARDLWRLVEAGEGDVVITDVMMPDENGLDLLPRIKALRPELPVIVMSARNTLSTAVSAAERDAYDYLPKPFDIAELSAMVERAVAQGASPASADTERGEEQPLKHGLVGRSPAMQSVYRTIARVVHTELTVLITGESGTGKELVARALHDLGRRADQPFVAINMAAIPNELIESELFGHEKGAFTGASAKVAGKFEQARGGTLFLDEIGDMPFNAQTRLLRVLQEGEFTPVGGRGSVSTDVRIIAATNQDLTALINRGLFREDLYYRLNVIPLRVPPLRERPEDIPLLLRHFLDRAARDGLPRKQLSGDAMARLRRYEWPGNVRELENFVRRISALYSEEKISEAVASAELDAAGEHPAGAPEGDGLAQAVERHLERYFALHAPQLPPPGVFERIINEVERPLLTLAMKATDANQLRAAALLGINRNTLRKKLRLHGIKTRKQLT